MCKAYIHIDVYLCIYIFYFNIQLSSNIKSVSFALFMHELFSITTEITSKLWHKYVNNNEQQQALEPA